MIIFHFDSSALVKRYVAETGSAWVRMVADNVRDNQVSVASIARVEVAGALARRAREGTVSTTDRDQVLSTFLKHVETQYRVVALDVPILEAAVRLTQAHPLRAYDAVQLATAQSVNDALLAGNLPALTFVTADDRLAAIATSLGLAVENPNSHP